MAVSKGKRQAQPWTVRRYRDGDEISINLAFNAVFNDRRPLSEWLWKFAHNPAGKLAMTAVAESNGTIIGQYASVPMLLKYGTEVIRADQPLDNFVSPDFQGMGLQQALFDFYIKNIWEPEGSLLGIGFPNRPAYIVGKRWLNYKDLFDLPTLHRRLTWRVALQKRAPWLSGALVRLGQRLSWKWIEGSAWLRKALHPGRISVEAVDRFDAGSDEFWERVKDSYAILGVRDRRVLNWRYVEKPGTSYCRLVACEKGETVGFAVLRADDRDGARVGSIVDFLAIPDDSAEDALIRGALARFSILRADYIIARFLESDRIYRALLRHGFRRRADFPPVPVVFRLSRAGRERLSESLLKDPAGWHLCMGDSDGI